MTRAIDTSGDAESSEPELLTDDELEHLCAGELVEDPLDEFADLITAASLRRLCRDVPE